MTNERVSPAGLKLDTSLVAGAAIWIAVIFTVYLTVGMMEVPSKMTVIARHRSPLLFDEWISGFTHRSWHHDSE